MKGILRRGEPGFPEMITDFLPRVKQLFYEGDPALLTDRTVAVVGSRRCTQYGKTVAKSIGTLAAEEGVTVISGLARGIDTAAHQGALEAGGKTIAVLGGGTDYYYPAENKALQQQIGKEGLLLSFHSADYQPKPFDFPERNQLIAVLSEKVAIVEAGRESGALITAEYAESFGRAVYAVPGNITSHYSFGTNQLIRDGVIPLILIEDIFTDMGIQTGGKKGVLSQLGEAERKVYEVICACGETTIDEIYHKVNMKLPEISGIITILEMKGIIFSSLGKIFVAKF